MDWIHLKMKSSIVSLTPLIPPKKKKKLFCTCAYVFAPVCIALRSIVRVNMMNMAF